MQSVSSRIWTRVTLSISYDDNHYTTDTSCFVSYSENPILGEWGSLTSLQGLEYVDCTPAKRREIFWLMLKDMIKHCKFEQKSKENFLFWDEIVFFWPEFSLKYWYVIFIVLWVIWMSIIIISFIHIFSCDPYFTYIFFRFLFI